MPEALLDDVREVAREFFHLPSKEKLKYANRTEGGEFQNEGYGTDRVDTDELILTGATGFTSRSSRRTRGS
jgi:isopenicillin N synthase-like dioxygenase